MNLPPADRASYWQGFWDGFYYGVLAIIAVAGILALVLA